jgi:aminoglycoside phosphotransferase (APT) family kinase protein
LIADVAQQILHQLRSMGNSTPDAQQLKEFLWKHHDLERIAEQVARCPREEWISELFESLPEPEVLIRELRESKEVIHCKRQTLVHGDLHLTNVALREREGVVAAFIFDPASAVGSAPLERDLASLEISALLHTPIERADFKGLCRRWYTNFDGNPALLALPTRRMAKGS